MHRLLGAIKPTPTGTLILAATFATWRSYIERGTYGKLFLLWILFLNRRALPFRWHLELFWVVCVARGRWDAARLGIWKGTPKGRQLGLKGAELSQGGIGKTPWEAVAARTTRVSFSESDYNLHLSNSVYAEQGDFVRFKYAADFMGVVLTKDKCAILLGATSFVFFREIPMFATYTTEARAVAWDEKWIYFLVRYITPYNKKSTRPPSKSYSTGEDCTVNALLIARLCAKRGRINIRPERVLALCGFVGPADKEADPVKTWRLAQKVRKERKVKEWMQETEGDGEFLKGTEEKNEKALSLIKRINDEDRNQVWMELDAII